MKYNINSLGNNNYKQAKKEVWKFLIYSPLLISIFGFLFMAGAQDQMDETVVLYFLSLATVLQLIVTVHLVLLINKEVKEIKFINDNIKLITHDVLCLKSRTMVINRDKLKIYKQKKILTLDKKTEVIVWEIKNENCNFRIIREFFDPELRQYIDPSSIID